MNQRSSQGQGQGQMTDVSRYFSGVMLQMWGSLWWALIYDIATIATSCRSRPRFGDRHDVIEWSVDTLGYISPIPATMKF